MEIYAVRSPLRTLPDGTPYYFINHTDALCLFDRHGRERQRYKGSEADVDEVVRDVQQLLLQREEIEMRNFWTTPGKQGFNAALYGIIQNNTDFPETLRRVTSAAAVMTEIHRTVHTNGIAAMQPVTDGVVIPPRSTFSFRPGDYHIMLIQLQRALQTGDSIEVTFSFARMPPRRVMVAVKRR